MTRPSWLGYAWAAPTSLLGLAAVALTAPSLHVVDGVLEAHGARLARLLDLAAPRMRVLAMTLGHVVIARDAGALHESRAHERVHVRQAECWGPLFVPAYLAASVVAWASGGDAYTDNAFERAAWSAAPIDTPRRDALPI
ncbi:MAG: hypothetical protein ABI880_05220 [Acidobacteriota bacterium]